MVNLLFFVNLQLSLSCIHSSLLPANTTMVFLSPLTYQGIRTVMVEGEEDKHERSFRKIHNAANGTVTFKEQSTVVFSCRLQ